MALHLTGLHLLGLIDLINSHLKNPSNLIERHPD